MRLGIEGGGPVEEATAAEHHPARLQLLISTVHKTPAHPNRTGQTLLSVFLFFLNSRLLQFILNLTETSRFDGTKKQKQQSIPTFI